MINIKQLIEGYSNLLIPKEALKDRIKTVSDQRQSICLNCPLNSSEGEIAMLSYCKSCGCNLKAKTSCLSCSCPKDKWEAISTPEENAQMKLIVKDEEDEIQE